MSDTLPVLTRTIDNAFVTTWYEIREEAVDNVLDATPAWAVLNNSGSFTPQVGGDFITRTIRYGEQDAEDVEKGDLLPQGDTELETMAIWNWKAVATHVQRDTFDDQKNAGPSKIKDYVGLKLQGARDGMEKKFNTNLWSAFKSVETGKIMQGFEDMVPAIANRSTGAYGRITRPSAFAADAVDATLTFPDTTGVNPWWGSRYKTGTYANLATELLDDMRTFYNWIHQNQEPPNLIITTMEIFEAYEDFGVDAIQIIKDETTRLADLGFEVLRFKGKPMMWVPDMTDKHLLMLNTDWIEVVYDPNFWFAMTDFKPIPMETKRIAHILSFVNTFTTQPRRHGRLEYS